MNSRKLWWPLADNDQSQQEKFFRWMGKKRLLTGESARTRKNIRMVKKLMCWLLCIWDKDMWKAHQVNVIRHQQILRVKEDGHKSIFLQFCRCYLNILIAQFTLGSAFHKGRPVILGWKKILGLKKNIRVKMSKHIPIVNCWASDLQPDDISSTIPWKKLI